MVSNKIKAVVGVIGLLLMLTITCFYILLILMVRDRLPTPVFWLFVSFGLVAVIWLLKFFIDARKAKLETTFSDPKE